MHNLFIGLIGMSQVIFCIYLYVMFQKRKRIFLNMERVEKEAQKRQKDFLLENKNNSLMSSIEQERIAAKKKRNLYEKSKRTLGEKIFKEIFRPIFQLYLVLKPFFQGAKTSNEVKMWFR